MDDPPLIEIFVLLLLILFNGFFSMSEMAIVSSRKSRLRAKAEEGKKAYKKALHASEQPSRFLSTIQIGITLIGTMAGAFGGAMLAVPLSKVFASWGLLAPYAEGVAVGVVVLSITFLTIVFGELLPKQIALSAPERIASKVVPFLEAIALIFRPIVSLLSHTTSFFLRLFRVDEQAKYAITEEEIHIALLDGERSGVVHEKERSMVEGVFYLGDRPVETFMTHRSELEWLELDASPEMAKSVVLKSRSQTYFPVSSGSLDEVSGIVSARDVLSSLMEGKWKGLRALMKKPCFVPGTMSALKAFEAFKRGSSEFLLIIDEYGGMEGALSIRDLIEEIVGELSTTDTDSEEIVKREDGSYLMGGLVNVDDFAELFSIDKYLPEHREYHTLAGFVLEIAGAIPRTGEVFNWEGFRIEIVDMDGNRIDKVIVMPPQKALEEEPAI
ncbi:hemolysin family protein [Treponema sp.]